jgi:GTP pyrophosphokinase
MPFSSRLEVAFAYAHELHREQTRKGGAIPYITHLLSVAGIVAEYGGDEDQIIAAFLHDAVEDQGGRATLETIRARFGETVAAYVDGCTDAYEQPKPPWRERKEAFLASVAATDPKLRLIIAADKLHNLRSMAADYAMVGDALWERFNAPREDIVWYHEALGEALGSGWDHPIVAEIHAVVERLRATA